MIVSAFKKHFERVSLNVSHYECIGWFMKFWKMNRWSALWKKQQQNDCAPSEDSDQPGHPPSLIRVFAVRSRVAKDPSYLHVYSVASCWSDWADAQADLSLRWAQMPFCWFCHEAAYMQISETLGKLEPPPRTDLQPPVIPIQSEQHIRATSWEILFLPYADNKDADQPAYPRSLIIACVVRCLDSILPKLAKWKISRL